MKIQLRTIPHSEQRYDTCGDWEFLKDGSIRVSVSDMGNEDYAFLVAIHEAVEVWLCQKRGITQEDVDSFDIAYEANRPKGDMREPGDHPSAPYRREHQFATKIERQLAKELSVNWEQYDAVVESL
jgi:hypothetical protein